VEALNATEVVGATPETLVDDAVGLAVLELARRPGLLAEIRRIGVAAAAPELARWVCPQSVVWCQARDEVGLGRHRIAPGERIACWLPSANRDEAVFGRDAMDLVLERSPNPHLTFCRLPSGPDRFVQTLGEVIESVGRLVVTGEPEWVRSVERSALRVLPVEFLA